VTRFVARIDGTEHPFPVSAFCDAWLADGQRFGDEFAGVDPDALLGRWPGELETDAVVRLAEAVGENATWCAYANTPPVAQKLAERARPQPLDLEIARHLQHLQHVCHQPRLHLRVEEERLPVSRARRTPVRAVAELVSHPGDWEHRTLRSIQPSRVLARQIEDEWNLYENRVAVRLVDHLLAYLAKRLEELRKIKEILDASRDYGEEIRGTSFKRAHRISKLWSTTLESKTEEELERTMKRLELAQRDLQTLLDAPLYLHVPRREAVALALKPTNILVNDPNYRKVAALWRAWVKFGHKRHETIAQRAARRQREAAAWDRFVLHLVVRGFEALGWSAAARGSGWELRKSGWSPVRVQAEAHGLVQLSGERALRLLPLCADLTTADVAATLTQVEALDDERDEVVVVHVGRPVALVDADRASGWSIGQRAVLFACSPWGIDSEERMARLLHGWLSRAAVPDYPAATTIRALPEWPGRRDWLRYEDDRLVVFRAPNDRELAETRAWSTAKAKELDANAQRAKAARQSFTVAPREAITAFDAFIEDARHRLSGLDACPICGGQGLVEARPGQRPDGSDATWWATCPGCGSEWGTRPCIACGHRYRALNVGQPGLDVEAAAHTTPAPEWPDRVLGRDVWAQPCAERPLDQFRCPKCGRCPSASCARCSRRLARARGAP
jgi:hypothetical protein